MWNQSPQVPVFYGKNEYVQTVRNHFKIFILFVPSQLKIFCYVLSKEIIIVITYTDKAVTKNDTREVYDIISLQWNDIISLHSLDCPLK